MNESSNVCRFCLNFSTEEMHVISKESEIMNKIRESMQFQIQYIEKPFLQMICKVCADEIHKIYHFHLKLTETQHLLVNYINKESNKEAIYLALKGFTKIQNEMSENIKDKENYNKILTADFNDQDVYEDGINIDNISSLEYANESDEKLSELDNKNKTINGNDSNSHGIKVSLTKFKCLTCFHDFESQFLLLYHYNTEHNKKSKAGNGEENYKTDMLSDGNTVFSCNICNKGYSDKQLVIKHLSLAHRNERPFLCKLCGRTYKTASEIIRHSRAHNGTKLFCSQKCGYCTVYPGALKEHERRHNKTEFKYKCEKCGKGFQVKTWYDQHQNIHSGLKPFVCDICGTAFHMDRYLTAHRSSMHPQSSDLKRYVCVHCSLPCDTRNSLTQHLKEHGIKTNLLCDLCGKTLSNSGQLKAHKRTHLGEKPFSCSTCKKSFTKRSNLQLHERTHTGVKSYRCQQCGKNYSQGSTLRRHNVRHHSLPENKTCSK